MANKNVLDGAVATINAGGAYPLPAGTGQAIRRGADNNIYLYDTSGANITSPTGLEQAKRNGTVTRLSGPVQIGQIIDSVNAVVPRHTEITRSQVQPTTNRASQSSRAGTRSSTKPTGKSTKEETNFKQANTKSPEFNSTNVNQEFSSDRKFDNSFNISRFRAEITGADSVLPTHSFLVVFSPFKKQITKPTPNDIRNETLTLSQRVTMRCDNIILPNLGLLQEQNIRRYGYGTTENVAYGINTGDVTMQFIVDKESEILRFFEDWFDTVVNRDSKGGADMLTVNNKNYAPYEVGYKDDYACPAINVFVYDRSNKAVFEYNIFDAFPINLQSINLSWSDENTMMKLNVSFAFTDFKINTPKIPTAEETLNTLRKESRSALEEQMNREDKDYEASIQRRIQENLSTLPGVTIGQEVLPTTISTAPRLAPAQVSINTVNVKTPNGQIVGNA